MRKFIAIASAVTLIFGLPAAAAAQQAGQAKPEPPKTEAKEAPSIVGKWTLSIDPGTGPMSLPLEFKVDGKKVTGTIVGPQGESAPLEGEFAEGKLTFTVTPPDGSGMQINFAGAMKEDGVNIWGRTRDVPVIGLGKSTLDDWIRTLAETQGRTVVPEAFPDKGSYYRSDHFNLAKVGVPAAYIDAGTEVQGRPEGWGREAQEAWEAAHYHQPSDELSPEFNLSGALEDARLLFYLGVKVANATLAPSWRPGDEFEPARRKALAGLER